MLLLIVIGVIIKKTGIISPIGQKNINDLGNLFDIALQYHKIFSD